MTLDELSPLLAQKQPINPRIESAASGDIEPDGTKDMIVRTAQDAALTINNASGSIAQGSVVMLRIEDDGNEQDIIFDTGYKAIGVTLPAKTVPGKKLYIGMIWDDDAGGFDVVSVKKEG